MKRYLKFIITTVTVAACLLGSVWWYWPQRRVRSLLREQYVAPMSHDILANQRSSTEIEASLREMGSTAVPSLIKYLQDKDPRMQQLAAMDLGLLKDVRALEPLDVLLESSEHDEMSLPQEAAVEALGKIGGVAVLPILLRHVHDPRQNVRASVARALGVLGIEDCVDPLVSMLKDQDVLVRMDAANSLAELCQPRSIPALIAAIEDDSMVSRPAAIALAKMGRSEGVLQLLEGLRQLRGAPSNGPRIEIIRLLGALRDARARPALENLASEDIDSTIRNEADRALEAISK